MPNINGAALSQDFLRARQWKHNGWTHTIDYVWESREAKQAISRFGVHWSDGVLQLCPDIQHE